MFSKLKTALTIFFGAVASIFAFLFINQKKDIAEQKAEELKNQKEDLIYGTKKKNGVLRENEELKNRMHDNSDNGFNASVELLQNISRSGKDRNK